MLPHSCPHPLQQALADCVDSELKARLQGPATRKATTVLAGATDDELRTQVRARPSMKGGWGWEEGPGGMPLAHLWSLGMCAYCVAG